jgi:hypothetical protein
MFNKLLKAQSLPVKRPRVAFIALNDGLRISSLRTLGQNVNLFETRWGMSPTQATALAQAIHSVFEASS